MSANVRCTNANVPDGKAFRTCGWTGERYAMGMLTEQEAALPAWSHQWRAAVDRADAGARTAKPCPQCGGQVELIPAEDRP